MVSPEEEMKFFHNVYKICEKLCCEFIFQIIVFPCNAKEPIDQVRDPNRVITFSFNCTIK